MDRTQLHNLIDTAYNHGRITAADALAAAARIRDSTNSTASILSDIETAITAKAVLDGTTKAAVDTELAAALGLSTLL